VFLARLAVRMIVLWRLRHPDHLGTVALELHERPDQWVTRLRYRRKDMRMPPGYLPSVRPDRLRALLRWSDAVRKRMLAQGWEEL
jgi:hypothetical protein